MKVIVRKKKYIVLVCLKLAKLPKVMASYIKIRKTLLWIGGLAKI